MSHHACFMHAVRIFMTNGKLSRNWVRRHTTNSHTRFDTPCKHCWPWLWLWPLSLEGKAINKPSSGELEYEWSEKCIATFVPTTHCRQKHYVRIASCMTEKWCCKRVVLFAAIGRMESGLIVDGDAKHLARYTDKTAHNCGHLVGKNLQRDVLVVGC